MSHDTLQPLAHICPREAWTTAQREGEYHPRSLEEEGFIHCSTREQVVTVANRFYRGGQGLVLLWLDPRRVDAPIQWEDSGEGEAFPHIYGPLNLDAVVSVQDLPANQEGLFSLTP
jgi:uncharacterized protein (DUF952 family)